jgi:replication-associated recombination protein RarA
MSKISFHEDIFKKLDYFHKVGKIPNIVFHGPNGSGKRTVLNKFINLIYNNDNNQIKSYVMFVNCAHGKGIKFIREELKFFAKTNISTKDGHIFKCVVLLNADKLTTDAQSALRRCIELYNHTTRFFLVVEDKYKLLKPILSRFCEIYVYQPMLDGKITNLCSYEIEETFSLKQYYMQRQDWLKKELTKMAFTLHNLLNFSIKIYEKGYCALDIVNLFEQNKFNLHNKTEIIINELLMGFNIIKNDIKNEKMLIYFILYFLFIEKSLSLNTIISI